MAIEAELQAQVDAQLLEQGAFTVLEFLTDSGRLQQSDYEAWRRREIEDLDEVLMGSREKILAQLEALAGYAQSIGLIAQLEIFHAWGAPARGGVDSRGVDSRGGEALRLSADPRLNRLIASRFVPAQSAPQMDLFFDNPVVALTNGIVRALSAGDLGDAQRQLDRLYAQAPNHADLAGFDRLLRALDHRQRPIEDPRQELEFLEDLTVTAKRLMGSQARDLLVPSWRHLAGALEGRAYSSDEPALHRSFALTQSQDWAAVSESVRAEPQWWRHAPLCLRLAQSSFHEHRRHDSLGAWFQLFWRFPSQAAEVLAQHRQPDGGLAALWRQFSDADEDLALAPVDFPAWLLLREPGLTRQLAEQVANGDTPAEEQYRCVHRWIEARRTNRQADEMQLRKSLQASHRALFEWLKRCV